MVEKSIMQSQDQHPKSNQRSYRKRTRVATHPFVNKNPRSCRRNAMIICDDTTNPNKEQVAVIKDNCKICSGKGHMNYIDPEDYRMGERKTTQMVCPCVKIWERRLI
jgi:hypothetical protein